MTKLVPKTLHSRVILMLVIGVAATHLISMTIHYLDELSHGKALVAETAERYVVIASQALDHVPAEMRPNLARALATPWLAVEIGPDHRNRQAEETADRPTTPAGSDSSPPQDARSFTISALDCKDWPACEQSTTTAALDVRFPDLTNARFIARVDDPSPLLLTRLGVEFVIMLLGTAALSYWAARWVARPLRSFAEAAERLGQNIHAAKLDETGPTEIRRLGAAFNEMQRRLLRFIDDRTQMLAAISHDLRTPITRLRLRAELSDDDEQKAKILSDLDQMERMTDSVLTFAKEESASEKPRLIDIAAVVESVCNDASDTGSRVAYSGSGSGAVYGRPMALKRAFGNLIENAVNYGGSAEVEIRGGADSVTVRIGDRGPGLPEHELEEVFKPFYRADSARTPSRAGTGLGLSIARSILRGHGGDLHLENRTGGGLLAIAVVPTTGA